MIHNSRLYNFFSREHTPCNSIDIVVPNILHLLSFGCNCLICKIWEIIKIIDKRLNHIGMNKHLYVCLLEDISFFRTPTIFSICRFSCIDTRLRIDCQKLVLIHLNEDVRDVCCFKGNLTFREWELLNLTLDVVNKYVCNIIH